MTYVSDSSFLHIVPDHTDIWHWRMFRHFDKVGYKHLFKTQLHKE